MTNSCVFYFLTLLLFLPKISLVLALLPIRLYTRRLSKRNERLGNGMVLETGPKANGRIKSFKSFIGRYIEGYLRYFIFNVGMIPSHSVRNWIYRNVLLVSMAPKSIIYFRAEFRAPYKVQIGRGSIIGDNVTLDGRNRIEIGDNVNFSSNVKIWTEQHDHRDPYFRCNSDNSFKVTIGNRVWIGPDVTILPGVILGEGVVVCAGAIVTKSFPAYAIIAGIPAKRIGSRNQELLYEFSGRACPFY